MRLIVFVLALFLNMSPLQAGNARITQLYELMRISESVEILRDEGLAFALDSEEVLFDGPAIGDWNGAMLRVYDLGRLQQIVSDGFHEAMQGVDLAPLLEFYQSAQGRRVVDLELTARRAFLAPGVEEGARAAWRDDPDGAAHHDAIRAFIEVNDLIERNVMGAMNSNFKFLRALSAGEPELSETQILAEVWAEEEALRADTVEWMHAFLTMAYAPLDAADMQANLALWHTDAGHALNNALFVGFDRMFERISEELGAAAAHMLVQEEL